MVLPSKFIFTSLRRFLGFFSSFFWPFFSSASWDVHCIKFHCKQGTLSLWRNQFPSQGIHQRITRYLLYFLMQFKLPSVVFHPINCQVVPTRPAELSPAGALLEKIIRAAAEAIISNSTLLNELDAKVGDGDCGTTVRYFPLHLPLFFLSFSPPFPCFFW